MSEKINIIIAAQTNAAVKGLDQVSKSTQRVGQSVQTAQAKMGSFNKGVTAGNVNLRKFAMGGAQQAGYQIGDFAVQVANGTSKMQAFGQQAPQLLQIFGPIGAVVGAAVAIFAAFAVVAQKTSKAAGNAATAVDDLNKAFDTLEKVDFDSLGKEMTKPAQMVLDKYAGVISMIQEVAQEERLVAFKNVIDKFAPKKAIDRAIGQVQSLQNELNDLPEGVSPSETFSFEFGVAKAYLADLQNMREIMNGLDATSREEAINKLAIVRQTLHSQDLLTDELKRELTAYADQFGLVSQIESQVDAANKSERDRVKNLAKSNKELFYQDSILRMMNIKTSDMGTLFRIMVTDQERRFQLLQDEDAVMGQLVVKAAMYKKSTYEGGRGGDPRQFTYMDDFRKQLAESGAAFDKLKETGPKALKAISITADSELSPAMKQLKTIQDSVSSSFENGFMSMIDGTKSVTDAFRSMASEIIKELYRILVVKKITGFIEGAIGAMTGGGVTSSPRPQARPSSFAGGGYTGGGSRSGGLDGKGGFMAMMHPRESVIDHTKGKSSGGVTVVQNFNISTGVQQTVRAEIMGLMPQIQNASKAAVLDAKRRGGAFAGAF